MVGCDLDGVYGAGFRPEEKDFIIVTGRTKDEFARTIEQIGATIPVYIRPIGFPGDSVEAGKWKASIVNICKISKFYEDDSIQARIIKMNNPSCQVMRVSNGILLGEWSWNN